MLDAFTIWQLPQATGCLQWSLVPQKQQAEFLHTAAPAARHKGPFCYPKRLVPSACCTLIRPCVAEWTQRCTFHGTMARKPAAFASFKQRCTWRTRAAGSASAPSACMQQTPAPCLSCCGWQPSWTAYVLHSALPICTLRAASNPTRQVRQDSGHCMSGQHMRCIADRAAPCDRRRSGRRAQSVHMKAATARTLTPTLAGGPPWTSRRRAGWRRSWQRRRATCWSCCSGNAACVSCAASMHTLAAFVHIITCKSINHMPIRAAARRQKNGKIECFY